MTHLRPALTLLILAAWALSCVPAPPEDLDPLASLASPELSVTYTADYWNAQAVQDTATWKQAVEMCRDDGRRLLPNCSTVNQIHFLHALRESAKRTSKRYDGKDGAPFPDLLVRTMEAETGPVPPQDPQQPQE